MLFVVTKKPGTSKPRYIKSVSSGGRGSSIVTDNINEAMLFSAVEAVAHITLRQANWGKSMPAVFAMIPVEVTETVRVVTPLI